MFHRGERLAWTQLWPEGEKGEVLCMCNSSRRAFLTLNVAIVYAKWTYYMYKLYMCMYIMWYMHVSVAK